MTPSDAQLGDESAVGLIRQAIKTAPWVDGFARRQAGQQLTALLAALRDARAENAELAEKQQWFRDRIREHVSEGQRAVLASANAAVDLDAARRETAELRARIEAAIEEQKASAKRQGQHVSDSVGVLVEEIRLRAALSPAEERS